MKFINGMANISIKSEKFTPFGGIFLIMEQFDSKLSSVIDSTLGIRCCSYGYQYGEIIRSLMSVYFCGGSCIEDVSEIYRLRWAIESLYKQLKQNFPLHFFYGDSVNAIQIQTWVVLIANLLITVISRSIRRNCAFSQVVAMVRLTLMYYIDFVAFMENPDKTWDDKLAKQTQKAPSGQTLFGW